jgi:formimidoylglutamate deiminase
MSAPVRATTGVYSTLVWLRPEAVLTESGLERGLAVCLQGGRIVEVALAALVPDGEPIRRLPGRVLIPGFVNAHSHAFQRGFRAETEFRQADEEDNFWTWRSRMYRSAQKLDPDGVHRAALRVFGEMVAAGYTSVGEFHYVHHRPAGQPYTAVEEMSQAVIDAAAKVRIRLVLLEVLYCTGGIGQPLRAEQRRFASADIDHFRALVDAVARSVRSSPLATVGLAPHSVRAVPRELLREVGLLAAERKLPVHMHLSEQLSEVEDCFAAYGESPVAVAASAGLLNQRFTAVHATHLVDGDAALLAHAGARVCACPSTEANLGDGFLPARALLDAGVEICIGSDSHALIDPFAELRMMEYRERLRTRTRNVLVDQQPDRSGRFRVGSSLLRMGTIHGAAALGLDAGAIRVGAPADLVAIDSADPALDGVPSEFLPEALALCASPRCVREVWVGGVQVHGPR